MSFYPKNRLLEKIRPLAFSIPTVPNCQPYSTVFSDKNDKSPALTENSYLRPLCPFSHLNFLAQRLTATWVVAGELRPLTYQASNAETEWTGVIGFWLCRRRPMFVALIFFSFLVMGWGIKGHPLALKRKDMFPLSLAFCISIFLPPVFPHKPPLKERVSLKILLLFRSLKKVWHWWHCILWRQSTLRWNQHPFGNWVLVSEWSRSCDLLGSNSRRGIHHTFSLVLH